MQANRRRDTTPERQLRSALFKLGLRYRVDARPLDGLNRRADVVFRRARVAVFIDGCFWHRCPEHYVAPKSNSSFWSEKVEANVRRDRDTDQELRSAGWQVLRIWEHDSTLDAAERVAELVARRLRTSDRNSTVHSVEPSRTGQDLRR